MTGGRRCRLWREHGYEGKRIHPGAVQPHRPVEVRAGHPTRRPNVSDDLARHHHVAFADRHARQVGKVGVQAPPVIEITQLPE